MKTVTIPTCANPFVVIVNGIKYTYPAGATVEVPDDVAEVIEQHEEAKTEPAPVQPPYSGDDILAAANAYTDKKVAEGGGSGSGGGLPVVELETILSNGATLSESDITKMDQLNGDLFIAKCNLGDGEGGGIPMTLMFSSVLAIEGMFLYSAISNSTVLENICISNLEGVWGVTVSAITTL